MARRPMNAFALSFLDCMCCGFGAVILVFMIISSKIQEESEVELGDLQSRRDQLESRVLEGERLLAELRGALSKTAEEQALASGTRSRLSRDLLSAKRQLEEEQDRYVDAQSGLEEEKERLASLEREAKEAEVAAKKAQDQLREIAAEGNRQYLTGMRMGGRRILVLMDVSASMLAPTLVNVVRLRYLPDSRKIEAEKWRQAVDTLDWLTANFPLESQFQIYTFDTEARPLLPDTAGRWIDVGDGSILDEAVERMRKTAPDKGTSLYAAFVAASNLEPRPDNIYLLTDGLPTHGANPPSGSTVSGKQRLRNFDLALRRLPKGVPVNVILFAMEGDAHAAHRFWGLANRTRGSFMSPAEDWP